MAVDKKQREEQELERYGVWVKAGPDEIDTHDGGSLDLMDIEDTGSDQLLITEEEEKLLGELEESSLPDFGDFDEAFDDSFEDFSDDDFNAPDFSSSPGPFPENSDESTELLHKIEGELNALRDEIRQLKDELTGLRAPAVPSGEAAERGGFFEEESDETIALTGDELDNILDSADMTEEVAEGVSNTEEAAFEEAGIGDGITVEEEEEEIVDFSADEGDIGIDDLGDFDEIAFEDEEEEEDPALTILGSPDSPLEEMDSDTIEIDIPGLDETVETVEAEMGGIAAEPDEQEEEDIVSIDDIAEDFEEITDLEDFGLDGASAPVDIPLTDGPDGPILEEPSRTMVITESLDDEAFDEGEEVEIDLNVEDTLDIAEEEEELDVEMEDISLDDFGMEDEAEDAGAAFAGAAETASEESDVLAVDGEELIEEIDLAASEEPDLEDDIEPFEDIEFESMLVEGLGEEEEEEEPEEVGDGIGEMVVDIEDIELDDESDLVIEEIDLGDGTDLEEDLAETPAGRQDGPTEIEIEEIALEETPAAEAEDVDEVELEEIEILEPDEDDDEDIPEIDIDEAIDDIETVEEFSLEDEAEVDSDDIEELEVELGEGADLDESEMRVAVPDDDFNELPGTEEVDLDSLEALAAAPDLTEKNDEAFVSMPESIPADLEEDDGFEDLEILEEQDMSLEIEGEESGPTFDFDEDFGGTDISVVEAEEETPLERTMERGKAALELSALPEELKEQIKEVLKYMDQLLESLPDDKIQEFARSEHFEVYKKIFEELGISD